MKGGEEREVQAYRRSASVMPVSMISATLLKNTLTSSRCALYSGRTSELVTGAKMGASKASSFAVTAVFIAALCGVWVWHRVSGALLSEWACARALSLDLSRALSLTLPCTLS